MTMTCMASSDHHQVTMPKEKNIFLPINIPCGARTRSGFTISYKCTDDDLFAWRDYAEDYVQAR